MTNQTKDKTTNSGHMTLKDYYENLPEAKHPKTEFVNKVSKRCHVTTTTVRYWIFNGVTPANPRHIKVLEDLTGIPSQVLLNNGKESK